MKNVLLLFPNVALMADFIFGHNSKNAEVNCGECSLVANMEADDIITAVSDYEGYYKTEDKPFRPLA